MDKSLQTEKFFKSFRKKTIRYVKLYADRFYKQYRTANIQLEDLADDFITYWLTPKDGRHHDQPMQTWFDKFDPETMNLDSCLKVLVIRKLIDCSKMDKKRMYSLDAYVEEKGESFYSIDNLVTKDTDFSSKNVLESAKRFDKLGPKAKEVLINEYFEVRDGLSVEGKHFFDSVFGVRPMAVHIFDALEYSESEAGSVYVNGTDVRFTDSQDIKTCFVNSIDSKSVMICMDGQMIPFDKESGIDKVEGKYSLISRDLQKVSDIQKWRYNYVPVEEFPEFCKTL